MISEAELIGRFRAAQAKDLLRRGLKVQARARVLLGGAAGHPRRIATGQTRSSVGVQLRALGGSPVVRVGSNLKKARWIHYGTGIYGPRHRVIKPRRAKVLVFQVGGTTVFARSVKGMRPNAFLKDALPAARD